MRAACFSITAASLPLPSTSAAASGPRRRSHASFRCSPPRHSGGGVVRALDERLLEAAAPAETEVEDESGVVEVDGGGEWEGKEEGDGVGSSETQGAQDQRKSRRRQQQEEDAAAAESDRFKLINGKEIFQEKTYLVGVECKRAGGDNFSIEESLKELEQLADTAGLTVAGSTYQKLSNPNPRTYIGSGKVAEIRSAIQALDIETVIFDDELSAGQLRNLEKSFGGGVRVCDRTALILDIFNQRAATHEASLQVTLAQMEYQLPRLTKMWTHLERQSGGQVKGMGEKQIEVDKRILRTQVRSIVESYPWSPFVPVTLDSSMLTVLLLLSKYRLRNVPVIEPDKPVIKNFITQTSVVKGLQQCKGRDWFDYISALPLSDLGLPFMSLDEVITVNSDDLILEAFKCMKDNKIGGVPVVEGPKRKLVGSVSIRDIHFLLLRPDLFSNFRQLTVLEFMKALGSTLPESGDNGLVKPPLTCAPDASMGSVIDSIGSRITHRIYVVDGDFEVVGVVTLRDVISCFIHEPPGFCDSYLVSAMEKLEDKGTAGSVENS